MSTIYATADNLLSVIAIKKELEEYPEPYRSNGNMEIVVSFDVYKAFIKQYLGVDTYLATSSTDLRRYVETQNDEMLCRCFYKDIAVAVAKEIWYTDADLQPTRITHKMRACSECNEYFIAAMQGANPAPIAEAHNNLLALMKAHGYEIQSRKSVNFRKELAYASLLYAMSVNDSVFRRWSLERSPVYDNSGINN